MDALSITGTAETPEIIFDPAAGQFTISGRSLPEDVKDFYGPVIRWIEGYVSSPNPTTVLKVKMDYFNTASSKMLLEVFEMFKGIHDKGKHVVIEWHFLEDDEDMEDAGADYAEIVEIPFKFISYQATN